MRLLLAIALVAAPGLSASTLAADAPTSFATPRDAAQFLRDYLGIDNPGGPLAAVGRKLAERLAQGFNVEIPESAAAEELDDELDEVRPDVDGFRARPKPSADLEPSQRALEELRKAYESGVLARTVRLTLNRLSRDEHGSPLPVRVAILRVRSDRAEYRALVDALSRDILTAASADLVETNQRLGLEEPTVVTERAPANVEPPAFNPEIEETAPLPAWPWIVGAACALFALSFAQLLRARRHDDSPAATLMAEDDRFDSVTEVRPVRPGIHQSPGDR